MAMFPMNFSGKNVSFFHPGDLKVFSILELEKTLRTGVCV